MLCMTVRTMMSEMEVNNSKLEMKFYQINRMKVHLLSASAVIVWTNGRARCAFTGHPLIMGSFLDRDTKV